MSLQDNIQIGDRYELQPRNFYRPITGKIVANTDSRLLVEVENCDPCDRVNLPEDRIIKATGDDLKRSLDTVYFFS